MSAGPATKMRDYLKRWADRGFVEARERIEDLTPATLEAMDAAAAAEEWARQHEGDLAAQMWVIQQDRDPQDWMLLAAAAMRLLVQRRKEEA